jgi:DNA-binding transcriptional MerR regulator
MYTVKQLSEMAGVTPRTLRFYDRIGLLKPTRVGTNGYRYYDHEALLRLQQILLYRELDLPLERIRAILARPDFEIEAALVSHKAELARRRTRLERIIATVEDTLQHLKGKMKWMRNNYSPPSAMRNRRKWKRKPCSCMTPRSCGNPTVATAH